MISSRHRLGLALGFFGMCLFAGTLPATRLAIFGFDPLNIPGVDLRLREQHALLDQRPRAPAGDGGDEGDGEDGQIKPLRRCHCWGSP